LDKNSIYRIIIHALVHQAQEAGELLEWHGHNEFYKTV